MVKREFFRLQETVMALCTNIVRPHKNIAYRYGIVKIQLHLNIGFTLRRVLAAFTRWAITLPKMNRFR